jgi:hypothetical protein
MRATIFVLVLIATASVIYGQSQTNVAGVESRISVLGRTIDSSSGEGVLFLFGAFCALWAQNSGRNAWLWFFFGLFLSVIAVVVLLVKNENDRKRLQASSPAG